jgi:glycosyltransferase involved in cell wall biosynthesis
VKAETEKILIITYYWPPAGGSGVQRWMYFAKYLKELGWEPLVVTVSETKASYPVTDETLLQEVEGIRTIKTNANEPLKWYARLTSGKSTQSLPQGEVKRERLIEKAAAFIRGNFFIPDARKGWCPYAFKAAKKWIIQEEIKKVITTGPPHSTHLVGLHLKKELGIRWWADFRDPWTDIFYNSSFYRTAYAQKKDQILEKKVLQNADGVITTLAGEFHKKLKSKAPNQQFIALPNGYDDALMKKIKPAPKKTEFHIVYTGLLTLNQDFNSILEVLHLFSKTHKISFSLAGNISSTIISQIKKILPNVEVTFLGYLSHSNAIALMKSADLLLNFIFKGAETQMISGKLLEYMATEVPIISIGNPNSQSGQFVAQGSNSWMIAQEDKKEMKKQLEFLMSQNKIKNKMPHLNQWSRKAITQRLIDEVLMDKPD